MPTTLKPALVAGLVAAHAALPATAQDDGPQVETSSAMQGATETPVVSTASGDVRGAVVDGIESFFGIPYAAAPVGDLRWQPPASPEPWESVRDAAAYGAACPQGFGIDSPRTEDENCLFVNVQRPTGAAEGDALPVVVLIHGGGWQTGSGNNENLDGLVRETGVVGVTMNYRLGNLGYLAHPALTAEAGQSGAGQSGNYGFMDQQAALLWVRDNIARFGGDPENVTIGGESAGGGSVCVHMTAQAPKGSSPAPS